MKKKSLAISDSQRFGSNSPTAALASPKEKDRKTAPTITLNGPQVDAFCTCSLEVGEKGRATVDYVVKAVSSGDKYGSDVPTSSKPKEVVLSLTHVTAEETDGGGDDDEEEEDGETEDKGETADEEKGEEADETPKKSVSPKDAALED